MPATKPNVRTQRPRKSAQSTRVRSRHKLPTGPNRGIELLLIQNVEHLGTQGEVVEVKRGYAMNYLIPQGIATIATEHHKRMIDKHKANLAKIEKARLKKLHDLAEQLSNQSVTIEANANSEGHLYGSVGPHDIVAGLRELDFHLMPEQVRLEGPLKELGLYTVKLHLHGAIEAELKVWVVPTVADGKSEPAVDEGL